MEILVPIIAVCIIGLICGVGLSVASSVMAVKEDERFPAIRECLPGANCGACGYTGCDGYAKALLEPGTKTNLCVPGSTAVAKKLSEVLGVEAEDVVEKKAVLHCSGTCQASSVKHDYRGIQSCAAAKLFFGGAGSCVFGCVGLGDCEKVCPQGAICLNDGIATINPRLCGGCGLCASTCPQKIIEVVPVTVKTTVGCSNHQKGAATRKVCTAGCIGCKKCEKVCEQGAITVVNNLAVIDYSKCTACGECVKNCTTGCLKLRDFSACC